MFDSSWKDYKGSKFIKVLNGITMIVPKEYKVSMPVFCDICQFPMRNPLDQEYWNKCKCCTECGMKWVDKNLKNWQSGWRPSQEDIDAEKLHRRQVKQEIDIE
jgi:hypothetical protein